MNSSKNQGNLQQRWARVVLLCLLPFCLHHCITTWDGPETTNNKIPRVLHSSSSISQISQSEFPRGLRVAMMGDSLMRFQYLSLAYKARHGVWFDPTNRSHHFVWEKSTGFDSWNHFYKHTNEVLAPYEHTCDCYRDNNIPLPLCTENRYYYDPIHDNALTFITAFGHKLPIRGRLSPHEATSLDYHHHHHHSSSSSSVMLVRPKSSRDFLWSTRDWSWVVKHHIAQLKPKPTHVVLNSGVWDNEFCDNPALLWQVLYAVVAWGMVPIWRSTTYNMNHESQREKGSSCDHYVCDKRPEWCLDVSWTQQVPQELYADALHFYEPVYRLMNEQLLNHIGATASNLTMHNRSALFREIGII